MDELLENYEEVYSAIEIGNRLQALSGLTSVAIIPAKFVQRFWDRKPNNESPEDTLANLIGTYASKHISSRLAAACRVREPSHDGPTKKFKLGISGGSTMQAIVAAFNSPWEIGSTTIRLEIVPLISGPIPDDGYSAGYLAKLLNFKLPNSDLVEVSDVSFPAGGVGIRIKKELREARDKKDPNGLLDFDWIITGMGAVDTRMGSRHQEMLKKQDPSLADELQHVAGDLCSRFITKHGVELCKEFGDRYVVPSLDILKRVAAAMGKRVIVVAGGKKKVDALHQLLMMKPMLINTLITDELTAKCILYKCARNSQQKVHSPHTTATTQKVD